MRKISFATFLLLLLSGAAFAHAFLDHASPSVGSTLQHAPASVSIWFTQELEPAFSTITVVDKAGNRVDSGEAQVDASDGTLLRVSLRPLSPGIYKVSWRVVSVDTHATDGTFTFTVAGG